jgi:hypothetical protein
MWTLRSMLEFLLLLLSWYSSSFHYLLDQRSPGVRLVASRCRFDHQTDTIVEHVVPKVISLLGNIVAFRSAVMELLSTDSLALLFNLISTPCPAHNIPHKQRLVAS